MKLSVQSGAFGSGLGHERQQPHHSKLPLQQIDSSSIDVPSNSLQGPLQPVTREHLISLNSIAATVRQPQTARFDAKRATRRLATTSYASGGGLGVLRDLGAA